MQSQSPETRFLAALARAAAREFGADHPLARSAAAAAEHGLPEETARAQELLAALDPDVLERLLAVVHREMREDLAAIWSLLPGAERAGGVH